MAAMTGEERRELKDIVMGGGFAVLALVAVVLAVATGSPDDPDWLLRAGVVLLLANQYLRRDR